MTPTEDPFGRLVALAGENGRLLDELRSLRPRALDALGYLGRPGANVALAAASLAAIRRRRLALLDALEAVRAEAAAILGGPVAPEPELEPCPALAN